MTFCAIKHDLGMSAENWQECFGDAFIQALAGAAGCATSVRRPDDDSIDWTLSCRLPTRPKIDLQVKTWTGDDGTGANLSYPLKVKNYNDLIIANVSDPRILVVVTVSKIRSEWLACTANQFVLAKSAYWISLLGHKLSDNSSSVTVKIPRTNLITADKLQSLMILADQNEPLS